MAEWQTKSLKSSNTGGATDEGFDQRMQREKRERYEASPEFAAEQAKAATTSANIGLASASQVSHADIANEKQSEHIDKASLLRAWIAEVTGEPLPAESDDLSLELKSGVVLCALLNAINPGTVPKTQKSTMPFPMRENIKAFTDGARQLGVPEHENFETNDLFEASNMKQVLICLLSLGRHSENVPGYDGPTLKSNTGKDVRSATNSGKVRQLSTSLKELIPMGATPSTNAQPGSEEWITNQMKAEAAEKQAAAAKLAEASKPVAYAEMKPFQVKKLLKERGAGEFKGSKGDMIAKLEALDAAKAASRAQPKDEPSMQKLSGHVGAGRARKPGGRKPPSRIRAKIPESTPPEKKAKPAGAAAAAAAPAPPPAAGETTDAGAASPPAGGPVSNDLHIHIGGLAGPQVEDEMKLFNIFSKFGTVLAVTLRRRRQSHVSSLGKPKVSWALVSFSTEAEKQKALNGIEKLKLGPYVAAKPMDVERAIASKGEMSVIAWQHTTRVAAQKGGTRELYRCVRKGKVRAGQAMDAALCASLEEGDILEELEQVVMVDGTRRVNFETVWAERGPDLGLTGWTSVQSSAGATILQAMAKADVVMWRDGIRPTLLRRAVAMYKSLAEQSMVHTEAGGGVFTCVKTGVIRDAVERQSEKVGSLEAGSVVPISAAATLESGVERVRFESVWKESGPNLGLAGWSSIAAANGGIVLEPMLEQDAMEWRSRSLAVLASVLGRQGMEVVKEADCMTREEQSTLLKADGVELSRVAKATYSKAHQRWKKGFNKLSMMRALSQPGLGADGSSDSAQVDASASPTPEHELASAVAREVWRELQIPATAGCAAAPEMSSLIRTDLVGPTTFGAMAAAVSECAKGTGQTGSTAAMLVTLAASLAQLDAETAAAAGGDSGDMGDEV